MASVLDAGSDYLQVTIAAASLGECRSEHWPLAADEHTALDWRRQGGNWHVGEAGDLMWLCACGNADDGALEAATNELYRELFTILGREWRLQRVWHYLPRINASGASGLERYRAFCRGRSLAFEATFGKDFQGRFPAASAVGCEGSEFIIYACARRGTDVRYFENPLQVPAYRYSQEYGPRAPGFARASLADVLVNGAAENAALAKISHQEIYLSGTASIRDEHSQVAGGVLGQLAITVENLNRIAAQCGLADFLAEPSGSGSPLSQEACHRAQMDAQSVADILVPAAQPVCDATLQNGTASSGTVMRRCFKVYLRNAGDYPEVSPRFNALLGKSDEVIYLRSDICRAELGIEIEASVLVGGA